VVQNWCCECVDEKNVVREVEEGGGGLMYLAH
jgi:hypothetical protein